MSDDLDRLDRLRDTNASLSRRLCDAQVERDRQRKRADLAESRLREAEAKLAEPARTLRIEVTGEDVQAAVAVQADGDYTMRSVLESFAARLRARQWVEVPREATIPAGVPYRYERDGGGLAHERAVDSADGDGVRPSPGWTYLVPADRLAEVVLPDPDAELIEAMARAMHADDLGSGSVPPWGDLTDRTCDLYRANARAVLAVVREHDGRAER